jgi:hypothetical protein
MGIHVSVDGFAAQAVAELINRSRLAGDYETISKLLSLSE